MYTIIVSPEARADLTNTESIEIIRILHGSQDLDRLFNPVPNQD